MTAADTPDFSENVEQQRRFHATGATRDLTFRRDQLRRLRTALKTHEQAILAALGTDLGRPEAESYAAEFAIVLVEIDKALRHLANWSHPRRQRSPLVLFPAKSWIEAEPYGLTLIIAPWNYPFQLALAPLVAAIAAGNCAIVKPAEGAPETANKVCRLLNETFDPHFVQAISGGVPETEALLRQRYDLIFFTGGAKVGKIILKAAAPHLTPVILELGGKNPCIIEPDADLVKAARRIVWGKFINAGQTCIAPDFLLVHKDVKTELIQNLSREISRFYGSDPKQSPDYGRIINAQHFERLQALLEDGDVVAGGEADADQRYIAPTVLDGITWDSQIMRDEIFGPILPIITYDDLDEVISRLAIRPKPLALYMFTGNRQSESKIGRLSAGGVAINDVFAQLMNLDLPFGGVGESGMGSYHGKAGFDAFSHLKPVVRRSTWFDMPMKFPPYRTPMWLLRKLLPFVF